MTKYDNIDLKYFPLHTFQKSEGISYQPLAIFSIQQNLINSVPDYTSFTFPKYQKNRMTFT